MGTVIATFDNVTDADKAVTGLRNAGILAENIGLIVSEEARDRYFNSEKRSPKSVLNTDITTSVPEGTAVGATVGGILGGIAAGLAAVGAVAAPGVGLLASGPIVAALAGGGAGAAVGGLAGALIGLGIPEYNAKFYEDKLETGHILVTVNTLDAKQHSQVESILKEYQPDAVDA